MVLFLTTKDSGLLRRLAMTLPFDRLCEWLMRVNFQTNGEMTKFITGNRAMWLNVLHFTGLLRRLAMTIHVAVIARNEAIQKTQNINVLKNLSSVACEAIQ